MTSLTIDPGCDFGFIPDYLVPVVADLAATGIPEFLRSYGSNDKNNRYFVFGGQASNEYAQRPVLTVDWDLVLETSGDKANMARQLRAFTTMLHTSLLAYSRRRPWFVSMPPGFLDISFLDFDVYMVYRLAIKDPFINKKYFLVDVHHCHASPTAAYCDYMDRRFLKDGIYYAPKDMLILELNRVVRERRETYEETLQKLNAVNPPDEIAAYLKQVMESPDIPVEKQQLLRTVFRDYQQSESRTRSLERRHVKDTIKYLRTKQRYEDLGSSVWSITLKIRTHDSVSSA